ncbi:NAD(P)H-binding protein [Actinosynnema pretiosum subsp. pretiosum]|uniref:NAD(P)H-binding protein n=1 Tax=Actinosynnema pretiosum subsp. pretiosum TaxID=103721 RepID=A0AA45L660_9PSEU|nr:Oxidoreductase [Actinosynnema pretiosum subsp. pretiosum]QUF03788.1 NAD(P)H-binding protein [Actinosynnema pretiosum subsp. pretiosum]
MPVEPVPSPHVLVTGANGNTGRHVAAGLLARGATVTAASRSANPSFDWHDPRTHAAALDNATAVYLVPPAGDPEPQRVMLPFLKRAKDSGVRRAVLLSAAMLPPGGPAAGSVHPALPELFDEWTVLRPSWFMQNLTDDHLHAHSVRADSTITTATGDGKVAFIDAEDIARVAVEALLRPDPFNTDLILTGPESLSYQQIAAILTDVLGREITHTAVTAAEFQRRYAEAGIPAEFAALLAQGDTAIAAGAEDRTTTAVRTVTGREPRSFRDFATARAAARRETTGGTDRTGVTEPLGSVRTPIQR